MNSNLLVWQVISNQLRSIRHHRGRSASNLGCIIFKRHTLSTSTSFAFTISLTVTCYQLVATDLLCVKHIVVFDLKLVGCQWARNSVVLTPCTNLGLNPKLFEVRTKQLLLGWRDNRLDWLAASARVIIRPIIAGHLVHLDLVYQALDRGFFSLELIWAWMMRTNRLVVDWHFQALNKSAFNCHFLRLGRSAIFILYKLVLACLS